MTIVPLGERGFVDTLKVLEKSSFPSHELRRCIKSVFNK